MKLAREMTLASHIPPSYIKDHDQQLVMFARALGFSSDK